MKTRVHLMLLLLSLGSLAVAEPGGGGASGGGYRSKYGFDVKAFKPNPMNGVGWIGGIRTGRFLGTSNVHVSLNGFYGTPTGGNPSDEFLYYGGLGLGYDFRMSKVFLAELGIIVGYGYGKSRTLNVAQTSYYLVEPSFGMGFGLGNGWRLIFSASYVHMTQAKEFSGATFGIRIDFKTQTITKEIND
jgi:hypothetical protein